MQSLPKRIHFEGVLHIQNGNSFRRSSDNNLGLRVGSQLDISLYCERMTIKSRRELREQMRKVKSVETSGERQRKRFIESHLPVEEKVKMSVGQSHRFLYEEEDFNNGML